MEPKFHHMLAYDSLSRWMYFALLLLYTLVVSTGIHIKHCRM